MSVSTPARMALPKAAALQGNAGASSGPLPPLLVGLSGGRDSVVLLHYLRFHHPGRPPLAALHVDHGLRPESGEDAAWVRGLCLGWGIPLRVVRLDPPPRGEGPAREARHEALRAEARRIGARRILLAHHADDQAETILFRLLRGTGPRGLAGIPPVRPVRGDGLTDRGGGEGVGAPSTDRALLQVERPLLGVPGDALARWAKSHGLAWREDATNRDPGPARNRIRHEILPRLERASPGTRATLRALGRAARGRETALAELLAPALQALHRPGSPDPLGDPEPSLIEVARAPLRTYPPPLRRELLRALARRLRTRPGRRGLELLDAFVMQGESGHSLVPAPALRATLDFELLRLARWEEGGEWRTDAEENGDTCHSISSPAEAGRIEGWGGRWTLAWGPSPLPGEEDADFLVRFSPSDLAFPLRIRGRRPGDRLAPGGRRLKKLLASRRVSRSARDRIPLLVDRNGGVLCVVGVWPRSSPASDPSLATHPSSPTPPTWTLGAFHGLDPA